MYECMHVCMYASMHACMYACMHAYIYEFMSRRLKLSGHYDLAARRVINHSGEP